MFSKSKNSTHSVMVIKLSFLEIKIELMCDISIELHFPIRSASILESEGKI